MVQDEGKEQEVSMNINFQRGMRADDGIHDTITVNEYRPKCGWLEHYRRKDNLRDNLLAGALVAILVALYLTAGTLAFYWG